MRMTYGGAAPERGDAAILQGRNLVDGFLFL